MKPYAAVERQLEKSTEFFIIDDDHALAGGQGYKRFARHDLQSAARRFLYRFVEISELNTFLIEDGHLTASDVEEVARHRSNMRPVESAATQSAAAIRTCSRTLSFIDAEIVRLRNLETGMIEKA